MNHEVYCLRPLAVPTKRDIAWQCLMVEFGIDFAFDDAYELPAVLPADMTDVKAVAIDIGSWDAYRRGPLASRLKMFESSGRVVFKYWGPEQFDAVDENSTRGALDMMIASADLTMDHPRLRSRLQGRSLAELYRALREPYFLGQIETGLSRGPGGVFGEPFNFNILETMELLDEYDPAFGWHARLRQTIDRMLVMPVELENLDAVTVLPVLVRISRGAGDARYRDLAHRLVRQVLDTYPRIDGVAVLQPGRDRILWNECLAHFPPACAALGDADLLEYALHTARTIHRLNFDPRKKLWRHWGAPGIPAPGHAGCPALWARGHAWALTGLVGILRHLPDNHPGRPELLGYLDEMIDGLTATQNSEGLWHNVMDKPESSRVCSRASAMICYLLCEGRRKGWVRPERVDAMLHRAWRGVRGRVWRDKLCMNCCGTGAGATLQHYLSRPMLFTGAAAALRAGVSYSLAFGAGQQGEGR